MAVANLVAENFSFAARAPVQSGPKGGKRLIKLLDPCLVFSVIETGITKTVTSGQGAKLNVLFHT